MRTRVVDTSGSFGKTWKNDLLEKSFEYLNKVVDADWFIIIDNL